MNELSRYQVHGNIEPYDDSALVMMSSLAALQRTDITTEAWGRDQVERRTDGTVIASRERLLRTTHSSQTAYYEVNQESHRYVPSHSTSGSSTRRHEPTPNWRAACFSALLTYIGALLWMGIDGDWSLENLWYLFGWETFGIHVSAALIGAVGGAVAIWFRGGSITGKKRWLLAPAIAFLSVQVVDFMALVVLVDLVRMVGVPLALFWSANRTSFTSIRTQGRTCLSNWRQKPANNSGGGSGGATRHPVIRMMRLRFSEFTQGTANLGTNTYQEAPAISPPAESRQNKVAYSTQQELEHHPSLPLIIDVDDNANSLCTRKTSARF